MDLKWIFYICLIIVVIHFFCYFFNIDLFECFDKPDFMNKKNNSQETKIIEETNGIDNDINMLEKSLEELNKVCNETHVSNEMGELI